MTISITAVTPGGVTPGRLGIITTQGVRLRANPATSMLTGLPGSSAVAP